MTSPGWNSTTVPSIVMVGIRAGQCSGGPRQAPDPRPDPRRRWYRLRVARVPKKPADDAQARKSRPAPTARDAASAGADARATPRIAVLHGPDPFLLAEYTREIREGLETIHGVDGVEVFRYHGESAQPADVLDECRSFGLLSRHKLVIVDAADRFVAEDNRPIIERYAAHPSDDATLVLRAGKWFKGKLDALVQKVGMVRKCEPPDRGAAAGWAVRRAEKRHHAAITRDAAVALVAQVGPDLARIDTELAKLACATPSPDDAITPDLVHAMVGRSADEDVWVIQGPLASGDPSASLGAVRDAISLWRQPPTLVMWAELDLARKAHALARLVEQGENPFSAMKRARIWGPPQHTERLASFARAAGASALASIYSQALRLDVRAKTGRSDAALAAETLAVQFGTLGRGDGPPPGRDHRSRG